MPQPKRVEVDVDGRTLSLSNLDKVLYPRAPFTKGQVIDYYTRIAPVLLPHLADRALTLKRYPNGVEAPFFYEKNCPTHRPDWVRTATIPIRTRRPHDRLLRRRRPPDDRVAGQPRRPRAAPVARARRRSARADDPRVRPRPGPAGHDRRVLARGPRAARGLRAARAAGVPEDLRLEGHAGLRAAQHAHHLRPHEAVRPRGGAAARAPRPQARGLRDGQVAAHRQGVRRLEPERRAQDDGRRVLAARPRAADGLHAADAGRRSRRPPRRGDPDRLVFTSADVLERVAEHGDLFAPVETLEQELPAL